MILQTLVAPPNSILLVMDPTLGRVPDSMDHGLVEATESCVAIGTLSEFDGESLILLSDEMPSQLHTLVFDGLIETPNKNLAVCTISNKALLVLGTTETSTRVRIWVNHDSEPDEINIVVGDNSA